MTLTQISQSIYHPVIGQDSEHCPICLDELKEEQATSGHGKHVFHRICLAPWLENNDTCPLCKRIFDIGRETIHSTARISIVTYDNEVQSQQQVRTQHQKKTRLLPGLQSRQKTTVQSLFDWIFTQAENGPPIHGSDYWERPLI
jgi:hypothetical protein